MLSDNCSIVYYLYMVILVEATTCKFDKNDIIIE